MARDFDINYLSYPNPDNADGVQRWIEAGYYPGHFLLAILENNLIEAVDRADHINQPLIPQIVIWLYNNAPRDCWRSPEKVRAWHEKFWPPTPSPIVELRDALERNDADGIDKAYGEAVEAGLVDDADEILATARSLSYVLPYDPDDDTTKTPARGYTPGFALDDGSNDEIALREEFDAHELNP